MNCSNSLRKLEPTAQPIKARCANGLSCSTRSLLISHVINRSVGPASEYPIGFAVEAQQLTGANGRLTEGASSPPRGRAIAGRLVTNIER